MNIARVNLLSVAKTTLTHRLNSIISNQYEYIVQTNYDSNAYFSNSDFNQAMSQTEEYLTVLSECLNCPRFMLDLYSRYPIDCDLKRLNQARPDILYPFLYINLSHCTLICTKKLLFLTIFCSDDHKCNYMCDSVASCLGAATSADPPRKSPSPSEISSSLSYSSKEPTPGPSTSNQGKVDVSMSEDIVLESLISSIQEMLPDLGSGFLKVAF